MDTSWTLYYEDGQVYAAIVIHFSFGASNLDGRKEMSLGIKVEEAATRDERRNENGSSPILGQAGVSNAGRGGRL